MQCNGSLLILGACMALVWGHQLCSDYTTPSTVSLTFCSAYRNATCCDSARDAQIKSDFDSFLSQNSLDATSECAQRHKEVLCTRCDPYEAHMFDYEDPLATPRSQPYLCGDFCTNYSTACTGVVTVDCSSYTKTPDDIYCFPIKATPLRRNMNNYITDLVVFYSYLLR